jgi:hypothetical protein
VRLSRLIKRGAAVLAASLALAACQSSVPPELQPELDRMQARDAAMTPEGKADYRALWSDRQALTAFLSGSTVMSYDALHGTQVEYLSPDGRTALWYPGNSGPVPGIWKVTASFDGPNMCFQYGENTYNPVTGQRGAAWECGDASLYLKGVAEAVDGDVFGLMQGRLPFRLTKAQTTLPALAARAGVRRPGPDKVTW